MALTPGTRLGPYEIVAPLGAGGMGEVYKARDPRLERTVAIKILPDMLAADPQFRERFDREAKTISQLSHPHICTLFDVGEQEGTSFLVMEYIEGETLAARIAKGLMPVPHVQTCAIQMADALDAAHRRGILHRDLKPGNVMLTASGVKLLDFGLAKLSTVAAPGSGSVAPGPTIMPTTPVSLTAQGMILGTFSYMAPEVVEGEEADARADIWAFGCVLYEMLTGRRPFTGKSQASLVGAILKEEPPSVVVAQPLIPPALDRIVRTCLAKDPNQRVQSAHDLLLNLQWVVEGGSAAGIPAPVLARRRSRERSIWMGSAVAACLVVGAAAWFLRPEPDRPGVVTRFVYTLPQDQRFTRGGRHTVAVAPDGSFFVYVANQQLFLRRMNQLEAQPIKGTEEDPVDPVVSPDGQWIAYFAPVSAGGRASGAGRRAGGRSTTTAPGAAATATEGTLKKIPVSGGASIVLASINFPWGMSWQDGRLVIGQGPAGLVEVPDGGGTAKPLVTLQQGEGAAASPQLVNHGEYVLFSFRKSGTWNQAQIVIQSLKTGERRLLITGGHDARILPSGQLLYVRDGTLFGARFDVGRAERAGEPVPLIVGVTENMTAGPGQFGVSADGRLVYQPGQAVSTETPPRSLVFVDRQGKEQPIPAKPHTYLFPRFSPDGARIALDVRESNGGEIWIWDIKHEILSRLPLETSNNLYPIWTPDSRIIVYTGTAEGGNATRFLIKKAADGTGSAERLTKVTEAAVVAQAISPDGKLVVLRSGAFGVFHLMLLPLANDSPSNPATASSGDNRSVQPLIETAFDTHNAAISPDGRWIAYQSDESGQFEIYARPFPAIDSGRWQLSTNGGETPVWSRNGRELFYIASNHLMTVPVPAGPTFSYGRPTELFDVRPFYQNNGAGQAYDVGPDGRFVMIKRERSTTGEMAETIVVVERWLDEVRARLGK